MNRECTCHNNARELPSSRYHVRVHRNVDYMGTSETIFPSKDRSDPISGSSEADRTSMCDVHGPRMNPLSVSSESDRTLLRGAQESRINLPKTTTTTTTKISTPNEKQMLDIYVPEPKTTRDSINHQHHHHCYPVIMYMHGGAWMYGKRSQDNAVMLSKTLARSGYVTCSVDYRLSQMEKTNPVEGLLILLFVIVMIFMSKNNMEQSVWILIGIMFLLLLVYHELEYNQSRESHVHFPAHLEDCGKAYEWIRNNIKYYNGDPNNIFIMGHSAGGHLATLLSQLPAYLGGARGYDSLKGTIAISGVYSADRLQESTLGLKIGHSVFGNDRKRWRDYFPLTYVTSATKPTLLINGEMEYGLKIHAYDYLLKLEENNVDVTQISFKNLNHFNIVMFWEEEHRKILYMIDDFIQSHLCCKTTGVNS
jgi:acetyl esterase/lipase